MSASKTKPGKDFEKDFKDSVDKEKVFIYRLRDNAASFSNSNDLRFTSSNICDYIMYDKDSRTMYCLELKSTGSASLPFKSIRQNQIDGLTEAEKYGVVAGFVINFRWLDNATYFIRVSDFNRMAKNLTKVSCNHLDVEKFGGIKIENQIKKVHYKYDVEGLIENTKTI